MSPPLIPLADAQRFVFESLAAPSPVTMEINEALGCVIAREIIARESVPGFINSSMDGFALRSNDTTSGSSELDIVDRVLAGDVSQLSLHAGQAMRIMTGAPLPDGADAVCMIEEAVVNDERNKVRFSRPISAGENVRLPGDDVAEGELLFSPGAELHAPGVAVLAGQGFESVLAYRRPKVGVLSTGNELTQSLDPLAPGKIRDTNRPLLLALLRESGFDSLDLGIIEDTYEGIVRCLRDAAEHCDAVISTGGVSVGDVDHVKTAIIELGAGRSRSMQVAIRPAKPFAFGVIGTRQVPIFGLPGNPVSTRVSFELFVRPALRTLAGHAHIQRFTTPAVLDVDLSRRSDGKVHFVHVKAQLLEDGLMHVRTASRQGSHLLGAVADANAIAIVPDGVSSSIGDVLQIIVLVADELSARP